MYFTIHFLPTSLYFEFVFSSQLFLPKIINKSCREEIFIRSHKGIECQVTSD